MIVGGMRLITYDSAVTLKSGPHGVSVVAAPPVLSRASRTTVRMPGPREIGARRRDRCVLHRRRSRRALPSDVLLVALLERCGRPSLRDPKGCTAQDHGACFTDSSVSLGLRRSARGRVRGDGEGELAMAYHPRERRRGGEIDRRTFLVRSAALRHVRRRRRLGAARGLRRRRRQRAAARRASPGEAVPTGRSGNAARCSTTSRRSRTG